MGHMLFSVISEINTLFEPSLTGAKPYTWIEKKKIVIIVQKRQPMSIIIQSEV